MSDRNQVYGHCGSVAESAVVALDRNRGTASGTLTVVSLR